MIEISHAGDLDKVLPMAGGGCRLLLFFHGPNCGACHKVKPLLKEIDQALERIVIMGIDVEVLPDLATKYMVASLPTLLLIERGEVQRSLAGAVSRETLRSFISIPLEVA